MRTVTLNAIRGIVFEDGFLRARPELTTRPDGTVVQRVLHIAGEVQGKGVDVYIPLKQSNLQPILRDAWGYAGDGYIEDLWEVKKRHPRIFVAIDTLLQKLTVQKNQLPKILKQDRVTFKALSQYM